MVLRWVNKDLVARIGAEAKIAFPKLWRHEMRSNTGRPSSVTVFRTFWPSVISVICLGKLRAFELGADDALPTADLRYYPAVLVVTRCHLPGHTAMAADRGNRAVPNARIMHRLRADNRVLRRRYHNPDGLPVAMP